MGSNDENVKFVLTGAGAESRPAYMSMSKERYNSIMPPALGDVEALDPDGQDERCYQNGHTWGAFGVIQGDARNGYETNCLVCGVVGVREWIRDR